MEKTSKTIRISNSIINQIIRKSEAENRSFSNVIETICYDYFTRITRKEFNHNGVKLFPVHMDNDEIYEVVKWALSFSNPGNCCEISVIKHHGGKGVAFCSNHYFIDELNEKHMDRRYSFSIDSNWEILDYFNHWPGIGPVSNGKHINSFSAEKLNVVQYTVELIEKIKNSLKEKPNPKLNKIFENDNWTKVYSSHESYHLTLK